jgi:4-hydroxy-tetrahydrodipicolinate reductase
MGLRICVGGATGWTGSALVAGVEAAADLELAGAVARKAAGTEIAGIRVADTVADALSAHNTDVYIDYTHPAAVKANVLTALDMGVAVVVGTSGMSAADYREISAKAEKQGLGVVASGNFSLTACLLTRFSLMAASHLPEYEILDFSSYTKPDVPSGTAQELSERIGRIKPSVPGVPIDRIIGPKEARGADVGGGRVHSIRLPSYVLSVESVFGLPSERLSIRHDAGSSAEPYVGGTLLAARRVVALKGLVRGLDNLLFGALDSER